METFWDKLKWRVGKWIWAPPGEMPVTDPKDTRWVAPPALLPEGRLPGRARRGRGDRRPFQPPIRPIPERGGALKREPHPRAEHKAPMRFKGKGTKTARRPA
ncbi:MAG TPA: hypothetical protein VFR02_04425 [bacterium]|nr:hypothetical protein [bacterium]